MKRYAFLGALLLVGVSACSSSSSDTPPTSTGGPTSGAVTGTGSLAGVKTFANAYWIGRPDVANAPLIMFLFESPIACSAISAGGWDAVVNTRFFEFDLWELGDGGTPILNQPGVSNLLGSSAITSPRNFTASLDPAIATALTSYTLGAFQPDANGTVTVNQLTPGQNVVGAFDLAFLDADGGTGGDTLKGTFDATWCPTGTEP
jgi:hypothetical protein